MNFLRNILIPLHVVIVLISKKRITIIASASVLIALLASMQTIDMKNEAFAAEGLVPTWIKKTALFWATSPEVSDSVYLDAMAWLINEGIMKVDTATAAPSSTSDAVIDDLVTDVNKLEDRVKRLATIVDKMDKPGKGSVEFETVIVPDKPCTSENGWCPGEVSYTSSFYIKQNMKNIDAIIVNVHATSIEYPACGLAGYGPEWSPTDTFGITCDSPPGAGSVLVYTMIKGDGALLDGRDLTGPPVYTGP